MVVRSGAAVQPLVKALAVAEVPVRSVLAGRALRDDHAARALLVLVASPSASVPSMPRSLRSSCSGRSAASTGWACDGCGSRSAPRSSRARASARATPCSSRRSRRPAASRPSTPLPLDRPSAWR
ncbi:hypothetical protein B0T42_14810 [Rathayibacter sp. VKM Ac-2630]|nr:hypothetical protein B0T42_14810 [Rathayibacter sp. VKM Ac-2630]